MPNITLDVHVRTGDLRAALAADVAAGLTATPKWLPPKWFYDDRGSGLFTDITRLPEYYQTRAEAALLRAHAADVARLAPAVSMVELGSGTSEKTSWLLDRLVPGGLRRFVPFDVSVETLERAAEEITARYPGLDVHAVAGDFEQHLGELPPAPGPQLVAFLGGTIGNLLPDQRAAFLAALAAASAPGDWLLLGTDLVKDPARLVAAYDDAAGVTAEFDKNVLLVVNRLLGARFDPAAFEHVAVWVPEREWIEMRLRSTRAQKVPVEALGLTVAFAEGEELRTEVSAKFRRAGVVAELAAAGYDLVEWWTDGDFALSLAARR